MGVRRPQAVGRAPATHRSDEETRDLTQRDVRQRFERDPREVSRARHMVGTALRSWDMEAELPAIELAVSELVSNALCHGRGEVHVRLSAARDRIRLEVADGGGGRPTLQPPVPPDRAFGGWGLQFVDQLADDWGTEAGDGRTLVWMVRRRRGPEDRLDGRDLP